MQKPENVVGTSLNADSESSTSGSPASSSKSSQRRVMFSDLRDAQRRSISRKVDDALPAGSFPGRTQAGDLFSAAIGVRNLPPVRYIYVYLMQIEGAFGSKFFNINVKRMRMDNWKEYKSYWYG